MLRDLRAVTNEMDELEVAEGGRILFITPTLKGLLDDFSLVNPNMSKHVLARFSCIVEVPQRRIYSHIELLSGEQGRFSYEHAFGSYAKTADTEVASGKVYWERAGDMYDRVVSPTKSGLANYYETTGAGTPINWMVVEKSAVIIR